MNLFLHLNSSSQKIKGVFWDVDAAVLLVVILNAKPQKSDVDSRVVFFLN